MLQQYTMSVRITDTCVQKQSGTRHSASSPSHPEPKLVLRVVAIDDRPFWDYTRIQVLPLFKSSVLRLHVQYLFEAYCIRSSFCLEPGSSSAVRNVRDDLSRNHSVGPTASACRHIDVMKTETYVQQHPPTPPVASTDMQTGLHQLAQYNSDGHYSYDDPHAYGTAYGSSDQVMQDPLSQHQSEIGSQTGEPFGLGIQYVSKLHSSAKYD
jgi:hypothetical protein